MNVSGIQKCSIISFIIKLEQNLLLLQCFH